MKLLKIIFLCFLNSISPAQTNVYVALSTTVSDESHLVESFVAGYESYGGKYEGMIKLDSMILSDLQFHNALTYALANDYNLVLRTTNVNNFFYLGVVDSFYQHGIQVVVGAGNNQYHAFSNNLPLGNIITCGAGEDNNFTSYYCEFIGDHPFHSYPITSFTQQTGDTLLVVLNTIANGGFGFLKGYGVNFSDVTGYSNNPSGIKITVSNAIDFNSFKIIHNLGSGALTSGNANMYFQSYALAYVAGQLAYIKDYISENEERECSWWEIRENARITGSENNIFDTYNGYGNINIASAIANTSHSADPYEALVLRCNLLIEGFYDDTKDSMLVGDFVKAYLRNSASPYNLIDSSQTLTFGFSDTKLTAKGYGAFFFRHAEENSYYIVLKHRNSIETWSKTPQNFNSRFTNYDFTNDDDKAYGNNMVQKGSKWCLYSGDINQDGSIDLTDGLAVYNDVITYVTGYVNTDVTGDNIVDLDDQLIVFNNVGNVSKQMP